MLKFLRGVKAKASALVLGVVASAAVVPAFADGGVDTTAVVAALTGDVTSITAVGGAILTMAAVAIGFKWIKGMLFG